VPRDIYAKEAFVTHSTRFGATAQQFLLAAVLSAVAPLPAIAQDAAAIARGAYLAGAAGCDGCHTDSKNDGEPYAGGRVLQTPFGPITTPNITPDRATGIGAWSTADFVRAMRWGIAPDGSHYIPAFPFPSYRRLADGDLADLKAFLDSLPPVARSAPGAPALALFNRARATIALAIAGRRSPAPIVTADPVAARGAYLVEAVGRCGDCHTPQTWLGAPDPDRYLAGARGGLWGGGPNITPDDKSGIGTWSVDDIAQALKTGQAPTFEVLGDAMAEIVRNTARLTDEDRHAIAVYLKTVAPKALVPGP
jgi:mono/diheme cytochrome c family protein